MSKEIQLSHACPHLSIDEIAVLGPDRRLLSLKQQVASENSVYISVNDEFYIPRAGLYSQASLYSSDSGPYNIYSGMNNLVISTGTGSLNLLLPISRISTDDLVGIINSQGSDTINAENYNGHLLLNEVKSTGKESVIRVDGPASDSLGFVNQYQNSGKEVYPGWDIIRTSSSANRVLKFRSPVKYNPMFKVTYSMFPDKCLRCSGTLAENDWRYGEDGEVITIENENLLYQACLKILLTTKGSNPFHQWYGASLKSRLGVKVSSTLVSMINDDVRRALDSVQRIQTEQAKYQGVSFKERLFRINHVSVKSHKEDPSVFLVDVYVQNASQESVNISIVFTVPGVLSVNAPRNISIGRVV